MSCDSGIVSQRGVTLLSYLLTLPYRALDVIGSNDRSSANVINQCKISTIILLVIFLTYNISTIIYYSALKYQHPFDGPFVKNNWFCLNIVLGNYSNYSPKQMQAHFVSLPLYCCDCSGWTGVELKNIQITS